MKKIITLIFIVYKLNSFAQISVLPEDVSLHVGDSVSVSGTVYGGHYFEASYWEVTMLPKEKRDTYNIRIPILAI